MKHPISIRLIQYAQKGTKLGKYREVNPEDYVIDPVTYNRRNKYTGEQVTFLPEGMGEEGVVVTAKDPRSIYQKRQDYPYRSSFDGSLQNARNVLGVMTAGYSDIPFQLVDAVKGLKTYSSNPSLAAVAATAIPAGENLAKRITLGTAAITPLIWAWQNGISDRLRNGTQEVYNKVFPTSAYKYRSLAEGNDSTKVQSANDSTLTQSPDTVQVATPQPQNPQIPEENKQKEKETPPKNNTETKPNTGNVKTNKPNEKPSGKKNSFTSGFKSAFSNGNSKASYLFGKFLGHATKWGGITGGVVGTYKGIDYLTKSDLDKQIQDLQDSTRLEAAKMAKQQTVDSLRRVRQIQKNKSDTIQIQQIQPNKNTDNSDQVTDF